MGGSTTLNGKSALITGSLGSIGFATAKALTERGCGSTLNGFAAADVIDARLGELAALSVRARYHDAELIAFLCSLHAEDINCAALPIDGVRAAGG